MEIPNEFITDVKREFPLDDIGLQPERPNQK
jgi:hypothetical protein